MLPALSLKTRRKVRQPQHHFPTEPLGLFLFVLYCWLTRERVNIFLQIVKQLTESEHITEELKERNPMLWCSQLNNIRERATEIVNAEIIYV